MSPEDAAFEYELPRELIAQEPLRHRSDARLMLVDRSCERIDHFHVRDLPELMRTGDRLVLNDTKVILARLVGKRSLTGGRWHGLFLGLEPDGRWQILQKTRGTIRPGELVDIEDRNGRNSLSIRLIEHRQNGGWIAEPVSNEGAFDLLERIGRVPLPPYIRGGNMTDADVERYQTVFARRHGAVAAPTAGLHFTQNLLHRLDGIGVPLTAVTLHVGVDTFRPITARSLDEHEMHTEWIDLSSAAADQINTTRSDGGRVVAIGTTSVRVLESAAGASEERGRMEPFQGPTDLFIRPPYEFKAVDAMLTNFHFPRTTLLVLISTFAGRDLMKSAYEEAVKERYRFYSYGDAMLIV